MASYTRAELVDWLSAYFVRADTDSQLANIAANQTLLARPMYNVTDPQFGAIGDGVADDTLPMQAALDAAIAGDGVVVVPPGEYLVTTTLLADHTKITGSGISIMGLGGFQQCRITFTGTGYALDISGSGEEGGDPVTRWLIQNLSIWGDDSTNPDGGINAQRTYICKLHNVEIGRFAKSTAILLNLRNTFLTVVEQCHIHGGPGASWMQAATGVLLGSVDEGAGQGAWQSSNIHFKNSIFQYIAGRAIELDSNHADSIETISIRNCMFHHSKEGHIHIANPGGSGVRVGQVEIMSCNFETAGRTDETTMQLATGVYIEDAYNVIWGNNHCHTANMHLHLKDVARFTLLPSFHFTTGTFKPLLDDQTVSSITRVTTTATVTTSAAHGYSSNKYVAIKGADQDEYNGVFLITVTGASTFTYTVSGSPVTPATGTIVCNASIGYRISTPNTASRGVIHQSHFFTPEIGTRYNFDTNTKYISWAGIYSLATNDEWTEIVENYPSAFQGSFINRSAPAETGRPLSQYTRMYIYPDGANKVRAVLTPNRVVWDSAAPTTGTWEKGDICFNTDPADDTGPNMTTTTEGLGWICTATGTPGTWRTMGDIGPSAGGFVTTVTAGAGLTGGGSPTPTLDVGAGDGITVNADDVAVVSTIAGGGLTWTAGVLDIGAGNGITVNPDAITLTLQSPSGLGLSGSGLAISDAIAGNGLTVSSKVLAVGTSLSIGTTADAVQVLLDSPSGLVIAAGGLSVDISLAGDGLSMSSKALAVRTGTGITTLADDVIHDTGDFGDMHTNYPEHDQTETISGTWTFSPQTTFTKGLIVNEASGSAAADDFRVESNTNANMLYVDAGNNAVGIGTGSPHASASLHIAGTKAIRLPKLNDTQRDALSTTTGLLIYNTTSNEVQVYDGSWTPL